MQKNLPGGIRSVFSEEDLRQRDSIYDSSRLRLGSELIGSEGFASPFELSRPHQKFVDLKECEPLELEPLSEEKLMRYYYHDPEVEHPRRKKSNNSGHSFTQTTHTVRYRLNRDEDDSDSEDGHFSPLKDFNMKVYSTDLKPQEKEKVPLAKRKFIKTGSILAALQKPKQKVASIARNGLSQ